MKKSPMATILRNTRDLLKGKLTPLSDEEDPKFVDVLLQRDVAPGAKPPFALVFSGGGHNFDGTGNGFLVVAIYTAGKLELAETDLLDRQATVEALLFAYDQLLAPGFNFSFNGMMQLANGHAEIKGKKDEPGIAGTFAIQIFEVLYTS